MKKRYLILALAGFILLGAAAIRPAYAYFTTYTQTAGGYTVTLSNRTEITEEFSRGVKSVTITNREGSAVFVRVRAFSGSMYPLTYPVHEGWTFEEEADGSGWWYFDTPVGAGAATDPLNIQINNIPEEAEIGDQFNVVVVYESSLAIYTEDGTAYADWEKILDNVTEGGGN